MVFAIVFFMAMMATLASCTGDVSLPAGPATSDELPARVDIDPDAYLVYDDGWCRYVLVLNGLGDYTSMFACISSGPWPGSNVYLEDGRFTASNGIMELHPAGDTCSDSTSDVYYWEYTEDPLTFYMGPHAFVLETIPEGPLIGSSPLTYGCFEDSGFVPCPYSDDR